MPFQSVILTISTTVYILIVRNRSASQQVGNSCFNMRLQSRNMWQIWVLCYDEMS